MWGRDGIKASELIKKLEEMIDKYGDQEVWSRGGEYPEGINHIVFNSGNHKDSYVKADAFYIL